MTSILPYGGQAIANLRQQGKRPADMVLVSLVGPLRGETNPTVIAQLGRAYDWRWLRDLDVLVVAGSQQPKPAVRAVIEGIKAELPAYLGLWIADQQNGIHLIVGHVVARPKGLLRRMDSADHEQYAGIGQTQEGGVLCA